jgi:hypothetical protein
MRKLSFPGMTPFLFGPGDGEAGVATLREMSYGGWLNPLVQLLSMACSRRRGRFGEGDRVRWDLPDSERFQHVFNRPEHGRQILIRVRLVRSGESLGIYPIDGKPVGFIQDELGSIAFDLAQGFEDPSQADSSLVGFIVPKGNDDLRKLFVQVGDISASPEQLCDGAEKSVSECRAQGNAPLIEDIAWAHEPNE